jgi:hypothetical protein
MPSPRPVHSLILIASGLALRFVLIVAAENRLDADEATVGVMSLDIQPIYGAHRGIRRAKEAELGALREELGLLRAGERETPGDLLRNTRIAATAALLTTIGNVREWPVDAPVLLRFGLFALLGLASWFGSAIVDRLLDTAMG